MLPEKDDAPRVASCFTCQAGQRPACDRLICVEMKQLPQLKNSSACPCQRHSVMSNPCLVLLLNIQKIPASNFGQLQLLALDEVYQPRLSNSFLILRWRMAIFCLLMQEFVYLVPHTECPHCSQYNIIHFDYFLHIKNYSFILKHSNVNCLQKQEYMQFVSSPKCNIVCK